MSVSGRRFKGHLKTVRESFSGILRKLLAPPVMDCGGISTIPNSGICMFIHVAEALSLEVAFRLYY